MFLEKETFKTVIASTPLISIDLVIRNSQGQYLLGYRNNKPAQGYWFVPGGRILKDERKDDAFTRLVLNELGVHLSIENAKFHGVYEHFYDDCVFSDDKVFCDEVSTHYIVLAYEVVLDIALDDLPDAQHSQYKWVDADEMLAASDVHVHSKWYVS
ncbi:GDP-mannose mannosyl hydrolase [Thalassotalea psychrophila]|uniref:GDP-mannose mannosyl hydrolase n=1 Tax=Thalassotalea psychrophila TaxID=3065647 RepID=A0ABY9TS81_9GAMM|nr:GDP-mannose mannosyl hydrolase [Colwelliaceae bacterium SQ149]